MVKAPSWVAGVAAGLVSAGFAMWMIKPVGDMVFTGVAYALVVSGSTVGGLLRGFYLDRRLSISFLISILVGTLGVGWGVVQENPGALSEGVFFVALPLVWLVIALGIDDRTVRMLLNVIPFAGLVIGAVGVLYWLDATGQLGAPWLTAVDLGQGIGTESYGYGMRYYPISSLVFLLSFFLVALVHGGTFTSRVSRIVAWPASATLFVLLFVSGRRALFVSLAISLVAAFLLFALGSGRSRLRWRFTIAAGISLVLGAGLSYASRFSLASMLDSLATELFAKDSIRNESGAAMVRSWFESPLIGHGAGATVEGSVRSLERPWNFELQYHLVLNAFGAIGFIAFAAITVLLLVLAVRVYRSGVEGTEYLAATIAGTISLLVANASNPYLHTPGHYWMLFILVIGLNASLRGKRESLEPRTETASRGGTSGEN